MNPARRNKVDLSQLSEEEKAVFRKYGKLPQRPILRNKVEERKYFDSGDYELQKAGRSGTAVGLQHPSPEQIPHSASSASSASSGAAATGQHGHKNATGVQRESHLTHDATNEVIADEKASADKTTLA